MSKAEIDKIIIMCRESKLCWQIGKLGEEYYIEINLKITSLNYTLVKTVLVEHQHWNPIQKEDNTIRARAKLMTPEKKVRPEWMGRDWDRIINEENKRERMHSVLC